jgi:general L-amino acid transport system permease protein
MVSIIIGISGIALSLPLGIVLALGRQSNLFIIHTICVGFIEFIRGVPLITLLFTASFLVNTFLPPGTNFDIILRVIVMVTVFAAAYMAETIRGGLAALPKGQYEAADSLGLDYWKAQRLIIMPQALKISIPGIVNNFIGLFKDTTLVTFIGILDILKFTETIGASTEWHGIYLELLFFVACVFFLCCFSMSRYSKWLEQKLRTDHR